MTDATADEIAAGKSDDAPELMAWDSRARRMMMIYLPLSCFVLILLFPFYWMAITSFKPNAELYDYKKYNPFLIGSPTLQHIKHLLFETAYPHWLMTTMGVAVGSTVLSLFSSVLAAYAIQRLRFKGSQYVGLGIYLAYLVPPSILFIPLAITVVLAMLASYVLSFTVVPALARYLLKDHDHHDTQRKKNLGERFSAAFDRGFDQALVQATNIFVRRPAAADVPSEVSGAGSGAPGGLLDRPGGDRGVPHLRGPPRGRIGAAPRGGAALTSGAPVNRAPTNSAAQIHRGQCMTRPP